MKHPNTPHVTVKQERAGHPGNPDVQRCGQLVGFLDQKSGETRPGVLHNARTRTSGCPQKAGLQRETGSCPRSPTGAPVSYHPMVRSTMLLPPVWAQLSHKKKCPPVQERQFYTTPSFLRTLVPSLDMRLCARQGHKGRETPDLQPLRSCLSLLDRPNQAAVPAGPRLGPKSVEQGGRPSNNRLRG